MDQQAEERLGTQLWHLIRAGGLRAVRLHVQAAGVSARRRCWRTANGCSVRCCPRCAAGKVREARQLCCQAGQAWRSLSLSVGGEWGPLPLGAAAAEAARVLDGQVRRRGRAVSVQPVQPVRCAALRCAVLCCAVLCCVLSVCRRRPSYA
jgi:hypothetical protein